MDVEAQALEMGWKPQDQFKGPADKWVDAETYVRRGEEVLPLVRNENRKLLGKVDALNSTIAELQRSLAERDTAMTEFREFQTEFLQQRLKEQRAQILGQIREAREAGDDTRLAELEDQLDENRAAQRGAKAPAPAPAPAANKPPPITPEQKAAYDEWAGKNAWASGTSEEDVAKQGAAFLFGQEAARQGLTGKAFYDHVDAKIAKAFPGQAPGPGKVEDGRPSGSGGSGGRKTFAALPPEAKAYAESKVGQFVGANKMFKTADEWKSHYAKIYFDKE